MTEPKFKIDQNVWITRDLKAVEVPVLGIRRIEGRVYEAGVAYWLNSYSDYATIHKETWIPEDCIFASKQELLDSL